MSIRGIIKLLLGGLLQDRLIIVILLLGSCKVNNNVKYWQISYKVSSIENENSFPNPDKNDLLSYRVLDKYIFISSNYDHEITHYLFQIKGRNDTLGLIEYIMKNEKLCNINYLKGDSVFYSSIFWKFNALDTIKLSSTKYSLSEEGAINYNKYKNYSTFEGFFGCTEE